MLTSWGTGQPDQGQGGGEGRHPAGAAASDLRRQTNVRRELHEADDKWLTWDYRTDDKTAADYNLAGGDTLHLVLALRGGQ